MKQAAHRTFEQLIERMVPFRFAMLFLFHAAIFGSAYVLAWLVRNEFGIDLYYIPYFRASFPFVIGVQLLVGMVFGFYRGWWRYVGIADVTRLVLGTTTGTAVLLVCWYAGGHLQLPVPMFRAPRGVLLIDWSFSLLALFGARVLMRIGRDRFRPYTQPEDRKRVLIIGAGDAGEALAREIEHRPQLGMKVVGFVDDKKAKWGSQIRGINITGPIAKVAEIADSLRADEALIAMPSAPGARLRQIIAVLSEADLKFKTIPGMDRLVTGKVHVTQLRNVQVDDLLSRKRIELPGHPVQDLFKGKRVVVTGAGGTIGGELASQILQFEPERLALVERSEFALYEINKRLHREAAWASTTLTCNLTDICDNELIDSLLERENPHIVLHAAAHKHVPLGEQNPLEYLRNNCLATRDLAESAVRHGVERFVLISTDKAINPTSVMGASKRAAEIALLDAIRSTNMLATIVRFGNVLGSSGSAIPLFLEQIAAGGPITVTHPEVTRYFIRVSEAVSLVLQAATLGQGGQVFMLDMGEPIKIADLARDLIHLSNFSEAEIPIVFTGLRPGEKMFEEISMQGESVHQTVHPQIVITETPQPDEAAVAKWLRNARSAKSGITGVRLLSQLIPEFTTSLRLMDEVPEAQVSGGAQ